MKRLILPLLLCFAPAAQAQYFSSPPNILLNGQPTSAAGMMGNWNRVISDGNTAFNNFQAAITALAAQSIPAGAIAPFNLGACPAGWITADGTASTPDMRGRFARSLGTGLVLGTAQTDQYQDHTHTFVAAGGLPNSANQPNIFITNGGANVATGFALSSGSTGNPSSGNHGTETRPKNVALRFCMKT
jgi:hypothetical protein